MADPNNTADIELQKGPRYALPQPEADSAPGALDVLDAAFRLNNNVSSLYDSLRGPPRPKPVAGFDPETSIKPAYQPDAAQFYDVQSPEEMQIREQQIDRQRASQNVIDRAGKWGFAAELAAGATDPVTLASMLIPVGGETRLAAMGAHALVGAGAAAAQEIGLQATQPARTMQESVQNIGATAVLSGVLGALIRPRVPKDEFLRAAAAVHDDIHADGNGSGIGPPDARTPIIPETELAPVPPHPDSRLPQEMAAYEEHAGAAGQVDRAESRMGADDLLDYRDPEAVREEIREAAPEFEQEDADTQRFTLLAERAHNYDPEATERILTTSRDDAVTARQLQRVVDEGDRRGYAEYESPEGAALHSETPGAPRDQTADAAGQVAPPEAPALPEVPGAISELHVNPSGESTAGAAAANSPTLRGETIARGAQFASKALGWVSPGARLLNSKSLVARQLVQELANIPETLAKNFQGVRTALALERELWKYDGIHYQGIKARAAQFRAYRERVAAARDGTVPLTKAQFGQEISKAMRRGDLHPVPEVAQAAKDTRRIVFDPLKERAIKLDLLPKDVKTLGADSYLMRQYDQQKIRANLADWYDLLRRGFQEQGVDLATAGDIAHSVTRNILGSERGLMDWKIMEEIVPGSGRLTSRKLKLRDELLEPYLTSDIDHLSHAYLRTMAPEVEMTERFGSRDMKGQLDDLKDDYARMITRAGTDDEKGKIYQSMENDLRDITYIRDRLYGIYGQPKDPGMFAVRAGRLLRSVNALRLLGAATLAHFPDIANVIMRYGLPRTMAAVGKVLTSGEAFNLTREEAKRMGAGLDMVMNTSSAMLNEYSHQSQFAEQRVARKLTSGFSILTGETPLITMIQQLTSTMAQDELIRAGQKIRAGQAVDSNLLARMAGAGVDKELLSRIAEQHERFGSDVNGLHFGMSDQWADKEAAQAFESAVLRDAHSVTLRPGVGDTPIFMSTEWGKALRQFTTFGYAAQRSVVNPLLQGLAHGDPRGAMAMFSLAAMGAMSYVSKQTAAGQPIEPWDSPRFALEVLDKSNLMGWTSDYVFPALWMTGFDNLSRWSDRDPTETIGGPVVGTVFSTYAKRLPAKFVGSAENEVSDDAQAKGVNRSDVHFLRRLMPGQNLWYVRNQINQLEDAIGDGFDLPGKSNADRVREAAERSL